SWFDAYRGVIVLVRVFEGTLRKGQKIRLWSNGRVFDVDALGVLTPKPVEIGELRAGEVGFLIANIKNVADTKIGDTIVDDANPAIEPLPGFEDIKPMVFAGLYTVDAHEHTQLREALDKLRLNDSSFFFEPESSVALGFGFRCGFLGLLHMEIIQERLEREFGLVLIITAPGVRYKITRTDGEVVEVDNPSRWLPTSEIAKIDEPIIVHRDHAYERGRALVSKMRELIPRQMFEVAIQAAIGGKVIARESVAAIRKNVIAKCYGGDITRKRKLLEKQKEGKRRMKRIG